MMGDNYTHLYTYWTTDNSKKTGCFNHLCPGFVQVHQTVRPGVYYKKVSVYGGPQYDLELTIFQDKITGNWWFVSQDKHIGYWPKSLLPQLSHGASLVAWGGLALGPPNGDSPPMGNGHFPNGDITKAAAIHDLKIVDSSGHYVLPNQHGMQGYVDNKKCYGVEYQGYWWDTGITFLFGGPGGNCGI